MDLKAKIKKSYLDDILGGGKGVEYRQIETITLTDEDGRSATFEVLNIRKMMDGAGNAIMAILSDIDWKTDKPMYAIALGKRVDEDAKESV
jgi:hypothetical protein